MFTANAVVIVERCWRQRENVGCAKALQSEMQDAEKRKSFSFSYFFALF
jgi:hypothetical protein